MAKKKRDMRPGTLYSYLLGKCRGKKNIDFVAVSVLFSFFHLFFFFIMRFFFAFLFTYTYGGRSGGHKFVDAVHKC